MNTLDCIFSRRSNRKFLPTPVQQEKLKQIVEAGRFAPSGGNSQSCHLIVIESREVLSELAVIVREEFAKMEITENMYRSLVNSIQASQRGSYVFHYGAPALIVVANKRGYGNAMADSACCLENMMLAANELDLGSCWINQLHWLDENPRVHDYLLELGLLEDETICGSVSIGAVDNLNRSQTKRTGNPVTWIK